MTQQDRIEEFRNAVKSQRSRQGFSIPPPAPTKETSRFTAVARKIGSDLSETEEKLQKLSILASRRGLYNDRPAEIQELTYIVKQDIGSLNKSIGRLKEHVHSKNRKQTNREAHFSNVAMALQSKLVGLSKKFKNVLEVRTENLQAARERRGQFATGNALAVSGTATMSTLLSQDDHVAVDMSSMQQEMLDQRNTYIEERADAMKNIQSTIAELGQIFQQLALMIQEQGEQVMRIDENVTVAEVNVTEAQTELVKYLQNMTSNRWLMLKIFGVLIFFFIVFVVFAA